MKKSSDNRGIWRAIYCSLWDDPDFQRLTVSEKLLLLNLRTTRLSSAICIYPYYLEAIQRQTSLSRVTIESGLKKLCESGWIEVEAGIVWVKNGLKYDPNITLSNENHAIFIKTEIQSLPKLKIVKNFCDYYGIDIDNGIVYPDTPADGLPDQKEKRKQKKTKETDEEWLISLKTNPTYRGIDIDREKGKCEAWCGVNKQTFTRRRFINWLNRTEKPISINKSPYKLKTLPPEPETRPEWTADIKERLKDVGKKLE